MIGVLLVNGAKEIRHRNSEGCTVLECGCAHLEREWIQMCQTHYDDWWRTHYAARVAHYEGLGLCTSDAQGTADADQMTGRLTGPQDGAP